jgi:hypothetical protein
MAILCVYLLALIGFAYSALARRLRTLTAVEWIDAS